METIQTNSFKLSDNNYFLRLCSELPAELLITKLEDPEIKQSLWNTVIAQDQHSLEEKLSDIETFDRICRRTIPYSELYYMCYDCTQLSAQGVGDIDAIFCSECFQSSNHKGHRFTYEKPVSGTYTCDCGDKNALNTKGFCPSHPGYSKQHANSISQKIPIDVRERYIRAFQEILYSFFSYVEDNTQSGDIFSPIIDLMIELNELKDCFKLLCIEVLTSKLSSEYSLRVDLENFEEFRLLPSPKTVDCTYIELLTRFHFMFSKPLQMNIRELILSLIVDEEFKEFYAKLYLKLIHFIYLFEDPDGKVLESKSKLAHASTQLFDFGSARIVSASQIESLRIIDVLQKIFSKSRLITVPMKKTYTRCHYASSSLCYLLGFEKSANLLFEHSQFIEKMVELICLVENISPAETLLDYFKNYSNRIGSMEGHKLDL